MFKLSPQHLEILEQAEHQIVSESGAALSRSISLADGDCCDVKPDGTRVYYRPPDLTSIEYIVNRGLGTPGARIIAGKRATGDQAEDLLADLKHELAHLADGADPLGPDGPFRALLGPRALLKQDYMQRQAELGQKVIAFLPTAITRLTELCAGVTIRKEYNGKTRTYTLRPNRRAIEHISKRIHGASGSIIASINQNDDSEPLDPTRDYTAEEIKKLTTTQLIALFKASEALETSEQNEEPSEPELPEHHIAAQKQMIEFLPQAISHMKTLAIGASTIIETGSGETREINHPPDPHANQFFIDRFIGAPASRFVIKSTEPVDTTANAEPIARYTESIIKLCTAYPAYIGKEDHIRTLLARISLSQ